MPNTPDVPIYGDNVEFRVFIDGQPQGGPEYANKIAIKQDATIHKHNHIGRKRQRVGKQVDGYTVSLSMEVSDFRLADKLAERDALRDENQPVPEVTLTAKFTLRTGQEVMYLFSGCEDTNDFDIGDRNAVPGFNVEFTCEDREKVA